MTPWLKDDMLAGKVAWITGGGSGLGRATALRMAGLGAQVCVMGRREKPLDETVAMIVDQGGIASRHAGDVREPEAIDATLAHIVETHGGLDILLNNAAGNFLCPSETLSPKAFSAVVDIVLKGSFLCTRAAGRYWIDTGRAGSILSVATTYAETGSAFVLPSACAKAGVVAMTRSLAVEWARYNIRLNAIAPGPIPTEGAFSRLLPSEEMLEGRKRKIPAGRFGTPEEFAELACFLVSDASSWFCGELMVFDGGEWLRGAGEFNDLLDLPPEVMEQLQKIRPRK
ncbi:MAG: SDR family oxidoreductase [Acidobacteriota bacterium]|nr:SDR family oxidoreductase [Acidobacteriota bacterium]MDH3784086.1 SDR family oxidoreductase [Acidobacteriota bacterium]